MLHRRLHEPKSDKAHSNIGDVGRGEGQENRSEQTGASPGHCESHRRDHEFGWWEKECSGTESSSRHVQPGALGDCTPHREADVGGLAQPNAGARSDLTQHECQELGRVSLQDWQFQDISSCGLECSWNPRRHHLWRHLTCPGTGSVDAPDVRSMQCGSWIMGARIRAISGRDTTVCFAGDPQAAGCGRWRITFLKAAGPSLGRDQFVPSARSRRIPQPKKERGKVLQRKLLQDEFRRSGHNRCRAKEESQAEGQGQTRPGSTVRHCTGIDQGEGAHIAPETAASMKAPGSGACPVRVEAFLNSFPRWLLKIDGHLRGFFRSILMTHGAAKDTTSRAASTWPMPLPYPEVFMKDGYNVVDAPWKRLVCLQVVVFNWLVLNRPRKAPECLRIGQKLSARQWSAVKNLEFLARDGNTPELVLVHDMGRAAAKFEGFQDELAALCRAASFLHAEESGYFASGLTHSLASEAEELRCGSLVGALGETAVLGAKPLVASRLTFPAKPCFNPRPFFDEATLNEAV